MEESSGEGVIYRGALVTLRRQKVIDPKGDEHQYEIVDNPPAVGIVALAYPDSGQPLVALVRQSRPAVGDDLWELPAGRINTSTGESAQQAAMRELQEEVGASGGAWSELGKVYTSPGFTNETITLYLADGVQRDADAIPDPSEISSVAWAPLNDAVNLAQTHGRYDAKTTLGILLAQDTLQRRAQGSRTETMDPTSNTPGEQPPIQDASTRGDARFRLEKLVLKEFDYANSTAYQAKEDQSRMFNFYLGLIGALATAAGIIFQLGGQLGVYAAELVFALLLASGGLGVAFFIKLIRLRQAWRDSAIAMSIIKERYIQMFKQETPEAEDVFHWRLRTLPKGERRGSSSFVVCMTVAALASLSFGAAGFLAAFAWIDPWLATHQWSETLYLPAIPWVGLIGATLIAYIIQRWYFSHALNKKLEERKLAEAVEAANLSLDILNPPGSKGKPKSAGN